MTLDDSSASTDRMSIFFSPNPLRSRWFFWRTLEFLLALATNIFILLKYWDKLNEHTVTVLILVFGIFMLIYPYISFVRACGELRSLCQQVERWDVEHKTVAVNITATAQRTIGTAFSRYFDTVLMLLVIVAYYVLRYM